MRAKPRFTLPFTARGDTAFPDITVSGGPEDFAAGLSAEVRSAVLAQAVARLSDDAAWQLVDDLGEARNAGWDSTSVRADKIAAGNVRAALLAALQGKETP